MKNYHSLQESLIFIRWRTDTFLHNWRNIQIGNELGDDSGKPQSFELKIVYSRVKSALLGAKVNTSGDGRFLRNAAYHGRRNCPDRPWKVYWARAAVRGVYTKVSCCKSLYFLDNFPQYFNGCLGHFLVLNDSGWRYY